MSIRKWFKGAKAKAMIALGSFAMLLGVGASVSVATAVKENEVVETKAAITSYHFNGWFNADTGTNSADVNLKTNGSQYELVNQYCKEGTSFKPYKDSDNHWANVGGGSGGNFTASSGTVSLKSGKAGYYSFYWKPSDNKIYIESASPSTKTFYINKANVSATFTGTTYIHYWGGDGSPTTNWPGRTLSWSGNTGTITVPDGVTSIIFNNNSVQTTDILLSSSGSTYYVWSGQSGGKYTGHWGASRAGTFLAGTMNSWQCTDSNILSQIGESDNYQLLGFSMSADQEWKIRVISAWNASDVDYGITNYSADGSDVNADTDGQLFSDSGNNSNIKVNANGSYDIFYNSTSHGIFGYYSSSSSIADGYYLCGTNEFGATGYSFSLKYAKKMSTGDGKNTAYYTATNGISVSNGTKVKPRYHSFCNNTWYSITLGGTYGFADTDGDGNIVFSAAGSYNFYFKIDNGTNYMYIVDVSEIHTHGYLYFASSSAAGSINVTTSTGSETVLNNVALSTVEGLEVTSVAISFDGYSKLYRMPIFNLRGSDVSKVVVSATFSDGTRTLSSIPNNTSAQHVYAKSGAVTTGKGAAAQAVFELEKAMNGHSICDLDDEAISPLKDYIEDGYSGDSSLMNGAKITTCPSGGSHSTFNTLWEVSKIYKQICRQLEEDSAINAEGWTLPSLTVFGGPNNDQSPLTLTLWIVLGAGVLGLGAIGTAYFVSKKKKRHQA